MIWLYKIFTWYDHFYAIKYMGKWKKDNKEIDYIKIKRVCYRFDPISSSNALIKLNFEWKNYSNNLSQKQGTPSILP